MLSLIRSPLLLVAFALLVLPCPGHAQGMPPSGAGGGSGFQLVQRVDEVLFGVDPVSLGLIDNRYVSGTFVRVNVLRPSPVIGYTSFVADCASPQRIAISESASATEDRHAERFLSQRRTQDHKLQLGSLEFVEPRVLDGTRFVTEFVCEVTRQPARAARLARELFDKGGPEDLKTVYCDMQVDGGKEVRTGVQVRFSEAQDVVAVERQWLSSGFVTEQEVVFGTGGVQWILDRATLHSKLIQKGAKAPMFTSVCDTRPPR